MLLQRPRAHIYTPPQPAGRKTCGRRAAVLAVVDARAPLERGERGLRSSLMLNETTAKVHNSASAVLELPAPGRTGQTTLKSFEKRPSGASPGPPPGLGGGRPGRQILRKFYGAPLNKVDLQDTNAYSETALSSRLSGTPAKMNKLNALEHKEF